MSMIAPEKNSLNATETNNNLHVKKFLKNIKKPLDFFFLRAYNKYVINISKRYQNTSKDIEAHQKEATLMNAFAETRNLFIQYTSYIKPLSVEEWSAAPQSQKAALLFVQFYDEITLAWHKAKSFYTDEEDGVSIVCQYLEKNIAKISADPKRFTSAYIYKVAYNCMYCICHDIKKDRERWENEVSNIVPAGEDELDLFDTIIGQSAEESFEKLEFSSEFWSIIEAEGLKAEKVVNYLLSKDAKDLKKVDKRSKNYSSDYLRDIEVSLDEVEEILASLRDKLAILKEAC